MTPLKQYKNDLIAFLKNAITHEKTVLEDIQIGKENGDKPTTYLTADNTVALTFRGKKERHAKLRLAEAERLLAGFEEYDISLANNYA